MTKSHQVNVIITFRNTESSEALKSYASEKITSLLLKFVHADTEVHLVLKVEKNRHIAEVSFHSDGNSFSCSAESSDLYVSIDKLVDPLQEQLRRHKEKLVLHG